MGSLPIGLLSGLGGQQRGIAQQQLAGGREAWAEAQPYNNPWLQIGGSLMGNTMTPIQGAGGMGYSALSSLMPSMGAAGGGALMGGLTGLGAGTGALMGLLSDERLKENIKDVDDVLTKLKGLKLHRYSYRGDDTPRLGLIAQELEREFPEAVIERDGVKYVDLYALQSILLVALGEVA
jgi:hypothetical protein